MTTPSSTLTSFENTSIAFGSKPDQKLKKMHLLFKLMNQRWIVYIGTRCIQAALSIHLPIKRLIKKTLFEQFCGGETIDECDKTIQALAQYHIKTILDYSAEGECSEKSFEKTTEEILKTIQKAKQSTDIPFCVFKMTGIGSSALLEKIQQKAPLTEDEKESFHRLKNRVNLICKNAFENNIRLFIDAEETWIQSPIDQLSYDMMRQYNQHAPVIYNTFQLYRKDMLENLKKAIKTAKEENYHLGVKLVRGAYMEKERKKAQKEGYTDPIQKTKENTDKDYNNALRLCIEHIEYVGLCAGTHNEYSSHYLTDLMQQYNISTHDDRIYFSQLYGMSDHISYNLAHTSYNVVKYVPYGPVRSVMPYLFRRANENTSIAGQSSRELALIKKELHRRNEEKKNR